MYTLLPDEKTTLVMIYTREAMIRAELVTKAAVRINTFLRTDAAAEYLHLLKAQVISFSAGVRSMQLPEIYYPAAQMIAYHIAPPAEEPLDFDVSEKNRVMQPVILLVGTFQFAGKLRVSSVSDLGTSIATARTSWLSVYEVGVSNTLLPQMGTLQLSMAMVRPSHVGFALPG